MYILVSLYDGKNNIINDEDEIRIIKEDWEKCEKESEKEVWLGEEFMMIKLQLNLVENMRL